MDEKLYEAILKALKGNRNLKGVLNLLSVKDENEIEGAIAELDTGKVSWEEIVKDKDYQSDLDKLLGKAANTREEKLKEKYNFVKKEGSDEGGKGTKGSDSEWKEKFEELKKQVDGFEATRILEKKESKARGLLKEHKIPEKFIKLFDFDSDTDISEQFKAIQEDVGKFKDTVREELGSHGPVPIPNVKTSGKASADEIEAIVKDIKI